MRFVILNHQAPTSDESSSARSLQDHFDLMFETSESDLLKTFAVPQLPNPEETIEFAPLSDHRAAYLDYEGPISNNRGEVTQHASGIWDGELNKQIELSFDSESKHFAGEQWTLRFDQQSKTLLRCS